MSGRSRSAGPSLRNTAALHRDDGDQGRSIINRNEIRSWLDSSSIRSVFLALFSLFISYTWLKFGIERSQSWQSRGLASLKNHSLSPTLVIYVYSGSDPEYLTNLEFFIQEAIKPNDGCEYVIVLQQNTPEDLPWPDFNTVLNGTTAKTTAAAAAEINEKPSEKLIKSAPLLPSNARFLLHPNECFDLGTVGWVLQTQIKNINKYKYFIWLNSSVRGPFLPPYLRGRLHWTVPFTSKLSTSFSSSRTSTTARTSSITDFSIRTSSSSSSSSKQFSKEEVKLVGATINCGGAHGLPPQPHVQSYITATDSIGLNILLSSPGVFTCWQEMADVVVNSEIGASRAIFDAGYSIDCLMSRYQGFNWLEYHYQLAKNKNKGLSGSGEISSIDEIEEEETYNDENVPLLPCNEGLNPLQPGFNDGIDVNIYEIMFVKVKDSFLKTGGGWRSATAAVTTARWNEETSTGGAVLLDSVQRNAWIEQGMPEKVMLEAKRRGRKCFDFDFYLTANEYDLGFFRKLKNTEEETWNQFIEMGVYEGRPRRWIC
jgi:hypothetical protein